MSLIPLLIAYMVKNIVQKNPSTFPYEKSDVFRSFSTVVNGSSGTIFFAVIKNSAIYAR